MLSATPRQAALALDIDDDRFRADRPITLTDDIRHLLAADAAVAVGVSGGKDSAALAIAVDRHLRATGHAGPRILVHADLGRVEWRDSLPACQRLADHLGWELQIVRRKAGDLLHRWETRWERNADRYANLECVRLILPWSTPRMRFCTSEMKTAVIRSALKRRYPDRDILNVVGIRREESAERARKPVASPDPDLARRGGSAFTWNAILDWSLDQVLRTIDDAGVPLHEAYTVYGCTRVSCAFCIMSSINDLTAAATNPDNHDLYRAMVALEARSSFAFQGTRWLADVAPRLLPEAQRKAIERAKFIALQRTRLESRLPPHILYTKGWPTAVPTQSEARLLADTRRTIAALLEIPAHYLTAFDIIERYSQLMDTAKARRSVSLH